MSWGDRFRAVFSRSRPQEMVVRHEMFAVDSWRSSDQLVNYRSSRMCGVDRNAALSVPAVFRGRNLLCSISTLPLQLVDSENRVQDNPLFRQIDPNIPNGVMIAMTVEDLLFEAKSWWRITSFGSDGYPIAAVRYDPTLVSLDPPDDYQQRGYLPSGLPTEGVVYMDGEAVPYAEVIRFDSPNPALLKAGERVIARALALDDAADLYAANPQARGFFTSADPNADPADDEAIKKFLGDFAEARRNGVYAYMPVSVKYQEMVSPTAAEAQIIAQQNKVSLDLANALGIDPEDLGLNVTSRTYQNAVDRRKDRINDTLAPYMNAITGRLSMPDVTKRGYTARFVLDDYLKADPKTRAEIEQVYEQIGVTDAAEIREQEGLPPRVIQPPPPIRQPVPPTQISAIPAGAQ